MTSFLDPRIRMRDALRELIDETPVGWERPSLFVLRNRLLDRTGSDARPLAELLLEALRRGWGDRLPSGRLDTPRFDGLVSPFVMQWSAERFVQPEMARWAVESWAYALRRIDEQQLRIAPPPKRESMAAMAARLNAQAAASGVQAARAARALAATAAPAAGAARVAGTATSPAASPGRPLLPRNTARSTTAAPSRYPPAYSPRSRVAGPSVAPWIPRAMFGTLVAMGLAVVVRVVVANGQGPSATEVRAATTAVTPSAPADRARPDGSSTPSGTVSPLVSAANVPGEAVTAAAAERPNGNTPNGNTPNGNTPNGSTPNGSTPSGRVTVAEPPGGVGTDGSRGLVSPALTGGIAIVAPERPGVPSITRGLLSAGADSARMLFVQPARRAAGESRRIATTTSATPITFDELHLADGTILRGRVEVVRAGTVIFRDMKSGLRVEYRKDDIDEVITEFGTIVRFRAEPAVRNASGGAGGRPGTAERGVRAKGVNGSYRIRYAAATAVGSPECTQVWTRAPNAEDIADVRHRAGDDTLSVAFRGGDVFPSNVDPDGYFASTFRIVPDQARTMTALTTRLNGRFTADGGLALTVNIVFYRRLRSGEVTCNVTVKANGTRDR
ncbi:MAG: hypothetical protein ACK5X2_19285 [Gemmatimonadaceae bacterium]|nr:hypothetical protein [Gemmatimonadota bacterium]